MQLLRTNAQNMKAASHDRGRSSLEARAYRYYDSKSMKEQDEKMATSNLVEHLANYLNLSLQITNNRDGST